MSTEFISKRGCFRVVLFGFGALLFLNYAATFFHTRPKKILQRNLKVEWSERITRLESHYIGGLDSTTYLYIEGDPALLREIISSNQFEKTSGSNRLSDLDFDDAPSPLGKGLIFYEKADRSPIEYIGISSDGAALWYVALQY